MKRGLIGLVMAVLSLMPMHAEINLHEKVKDYLNEFGLPRLEYFQNHVVSIKENVIYEQRYLINGKVFRALFYPHPPFQQGDGSAVFLLDNGADLYEFEGRWYEDKECDGINGNEELY